MYVCIYNLQDYRSDLRKRNGQKTISKRVLKKENVLPRRFLVLDDDLVVKETFVNGAIEL